jgi:hypothetical protein
VGFQDIGETFLFTVGGERVLSHDKIGVHDFFWFFVCYINGIELNLYGEE